MKIRYFFATAMAAVLFAAAVPNAPAAMSLKTLILSKSARVDMHKYPRINRVYDVNYSSPKELNALVHFIKNVNAVVPGKAIVVLHGAEIPAFAKENYARFHGVIDQLAELSRQGVQFRMCNNAMHAAGFHARDIDGFITIIPAGYAEIIYLQHEGYQVIDAAATPVKGSRYLYHPRS